MAYNQKEYSANYQQTKQKQFLVNLNREHDAKIIEWLEEHRPYTQYLRDLIMADMKANGIDVDRKDARVVTGAYIDQRKRHVKTEE